MKRIMIAAWCALALQGTAAMAAETGTASAAAAEDSAPAESGPFKNVTRGQWIAIAKVRMEETVETLKLTEEQREAIRPIVLEQLDRIRAITESMDANDSGWDRMRKMRELGAARDEGESKVDAELTEEQRALAASLRAERREKMQDAVSRWRAGEEYALRDFLFPELATPAATAAE